MSDEQPRKRMRKGTHSCSECRRRKKSCVPNPASPGACTECFSRGVLCREQERSPAQRSSSSRQNLQRRVAELEDALLGISSKLENKAATTEASKINGAAETLTKFRSDLLPPTPASLKSTTSVHEGFDGAPVLSLFDNSILSRHPDSGEPQKDSSETSQYMIADSHGGEKMEIIKQKLLSLFPTQQRLKAILDASEDWWASFQYIFPGIFGPAVNSGIHEFVSASRITGNVQIISKALLCIAIGLEETSVIYDAQYNVTSAQDCTENIMSVIEGLVLSKDDLAGTIDGIECLVLQAKHDSNNGRVRRSWVTNRRAISFAQLQGLHLQQARYHKDVTPRRQSLWKALYQCDRFLSLLLGLPYGVSEIHLEPAYGSDSLSKNDKNERTRQTFLFRLANIVGHMIDRNQEASSNNALTATIKIEGELIDLAGTMASEWWALGPPGAEVSPSQLYTRYLPIFWHHQARTLLHLPFMLKATTDWRYEYNRIAALESARGMLEVYRIIRPAAGFGSLVCKVIDFQAFTAAMALVLNVLGPSQTTQTDQKKVYEEDRALISITTGILQRSSSETGGQVATQAARALDMFCNDRSFQGISKIAIPYYGTVSVGPGTNFAPKQQSEKPLQAPSPNEDFRGLSPYNQDQWSVANNFSSMPDDFKFGPYSAHQSQDLGMNDNVFADVNFDIDQDWSWFWDNTQVS